MAQGFCIWRRSSTWPPGQFWRGACRTPWISRSPFGAERGAARYGAPKSSTPINGAVHQRRLHRHARCRRDPRSRWTAAAAAMDIFIETVVVLDQYEEADQSGRRRARSAHGIGSWTTLQLSLPASGDEQRVSDGGMGVLDGSDRGGEDCGHAAPPRTQRVAHTHSRRKAVSRKLLDLKDKARARMTLNFGDPWSQDGVHSPLLSAHAASLVSVYAGSVGMNAGSISKS